MAIKAAKRSVCWRCSQSRCNSERRPSSGTRGHCRSKDSFLANNCRKHGVLVSDSKPVRSLSNPSAPPSLQYQRAKGDAPWPEQISAICLAETLAPNVASRSPRRSGLKTARAAFHISGIARPATTGSRRWPISTRRNRIAALSRPDAIALENFGFALRPPTAGSAGVPAVGCGQSIHAAAGH
jgi:hypothetical protein